AVEINADQVTINLDRVDQVYQQPMSGHYYQLKANKDWIYSRSLWDQMIPEKAGQQIGDEQVRLVYKEARPWLVLDQMFEKQGVPLTLVVAQDVSRIEDSLTTLRWGVALGSLVLLALMVGLQLVVIRRGLRSLVDVRCSISELKNGDIRRLPSANTTEVEPLVTEINYLVQTMELRLQRSRNAVGNLAHAAKTPLTVLDRYIDQLDGRAPEIAEQLREQSQQLNQLMQRELTRARVAGAALPGQRVFVHEALQKLRKTFDAIYRQKSLMLNFNTDESVYFPGEQDDLMELLGNLIDNACKFAHRRVDVEARLDLENLVLVVEDDGPGVAPEKAAMLMQRGERLDESISGHGLGLSIVTDIVSQYGGEYDFEGVSELGGLHIVVHLPLSAKSIQKAG
ncbi:MAG: ATP-binding protein, partial [Pontibacterium sp.]